MTITYELSEDDLLDLLFFNTFQSERERKTRQKSRYIVPAAWAILGVVLMLTHPNLYGLAFFPISILWALLWPVYERSYLRRANKAVILEQLRGRIGISETIQFNNDQMVAQSVGSTDHVLFSEITEINEIASAVLIKIRPGGSYVIPKRFIDAPEEFNNILKTIATDLDLPYNIYPNWTWKDYATNPRKTRTSSRNSIQL